MLRYACVQLSEESTFWLFSSSATHEYAYFVSFFECSISEQQCTVCFVNSLLDFASEECTVYFVSSFLVFVVATVHRHQWGQDRSIHPALGRPTSVSD